MSKSTNPMAAYQKAGPDLKQRLIWCSAGEVGTLKTSFGLGGPGPIGVINTDRGLEGVVEEVAKTKDVYVKSYDPNTTDLTQEGACVMRDEIMADVETMVRHCRTVLLDKETGIYEIFKYAEFGAPSDAPANYYPLFQRYRKLFNLAKDADCNFGVIQSMKDPWTPKVNKKTGALGAARSGERVPRGMPEVEEIVHLNLLHFYDADDKQFKLQIGKSRGPGGRDIQNKTIPYCTFAEFATLVFPETEEDEWT